jgi:predicted nucleic acid-binding protein
MIVCDANVLIGFLDRSDSHHESVVTLLEKEFVRGLGASVLTLAEALVHPAQRGLDIKSEMTLKRIGMKFFPIEEGDATALARVRGTYRVRMPDAVVMWTAMTLGAQLATTDETLARVATEAGLEVVEVG